MKKVNKHNLNLNDDMTWNKKKSKLLISYKKNEMKITQKNSNNFFFVEFKLCIMTVMEKKTELH